MMRKTNYSPIIFLFFFLFSLLFSIQGQTLSKKIDRKDLKQYVSKLASPALEGRRTGSEGKRLAAEYIAEQFRRLGLETRLEEFSLTESYRGETYLETASGKRFKDYEEIMFQGTNYYNEEVEKEVVFGGYGRPEELESIDLKGRIVLIFSVDHKTGVEAYSLLRKTEAEGLIVVPVDRPARFDAERDRMKEYTLRHRFFMPNDPNAFVQPIALDTMRFLNSYVLRVAVVKELMGMPENKLEQYIKTNKITDVPVVPVKIKFERAQKEVTTANVVGLLPGKSEETIVVSAHYDHLGKKEAHYYPGADDNASGVAGMLELAEAFAGRKDLPYTLLFLAFAAEEEGLVGSKWHVNHPDFKAENVFCNLNMDMISRVDAEHETAENYIYCLGSDRFPQLHDVLLKADSLYDDCFIDYSLNQTGGMFSLYSMTDSYNFVQKGVPALFFTSGLHPDYHKTTDTADKINYRLLESRVRQIGLVLELLQQIQEN
ncbi:hypothetical protein M2137_001566 [Parabacteroides sp. PFB2-10]|uniref:M20/M25/M40 family metallo-hydrolase n=1 Tax=Parabacteroides sp. PFB2-10 TaxID=1742405 RepID=UPI002473DB3C|nr:M20/M25/M40 family metallo-hydrolase [Parabacteroides sp. PFB2-10]MDH6312791.1 hypothetical protein [Parabacteroides sp. PFB2-10]